MFKKLLPISLLTFLLVSPEIGVSAEDQLIEAHIGGYLEVPLVGGIDRSYGYGFFRYVPAYRLSHFWREEWLESGTTSTWMFAQDSPVYSDIEGGVGPGGHWIRFPCGMHKMAAMGGVAPDFCEIADAPIKGTGSWDKSGCGLYAVAQLSNRLLFPPDGILFIPKDERGGLVGYGYINLPLADPKNKTDGKDIPTGGNCWNLVLNTNNFKGPVAFFTPYFWSRTTLDHPEWAGRLLDSKPSDPNRSCADEVPYIPCRIAKDKNGVMYVRMAKFMFPINHAGVSVVHHRDMVFNEKAFYEPLKVWFSGGPAPAGKLDPNNVYIHKVVVKEGNSYSSWALYIPTGKENEEKVVPLDWLAFATPIAIDQHTYGFKWNPKYVKDYGGYVILPEYYRVENPDDPKKAKVVPVLPQEIPTEVYLRLKEVKFAPSESNPEPYTTPEDPESCWKKPGPVAGPFKAYLRDGSAVTYYWYRFADQPALLNAGLTKEERERMQKRVEMIHRYWNENIKFLLGYLLPPTVSKLMDLDPAQIVTPPKGLEVGYVPIVVRQELAKDKNKK